MEYINSDAAKGFAHQSDFKSSVIPEFFLLLIRKMVSPPIFATGQKDCVYSCVFVPYNEEQLLFKKKYLDICVYHSGTISFNNTEYPDFFIPIVAIEVKTNIDKNMIAGMEFLAEELKRTFPLASYFAIAELADFAYESQNYAGTNIDEIYILRKQKRSETRKTNSVKNLVQEDVVLEIIKRIKNTLVSIDKSQKDIKSRVSSGKMVK